MIGSKKGWLQVAGIGLVTAMVVALYMARNDLLLWSLHRDAVQISQQEFDALVETAKHTQGPCAVGVEVAGRCVVPGPKSFLIPVGTATGN